MTSNIVHHDAVTSDGLAEGSELVACVRSKRGLRRAFFRYPGCDGWWRNRMDQVTEAYAYWRGRGSVLAIDARTSDVGFAAGEESA